jgi:hypothetical protein
MFHDMFHDMFTNRDGYRTKFQVFSASHVRHDMFHGTICHDGMALITES